ncbi:MAG TPA: hypothetical protein VMS56_04175 [Thermoanaerobaculia bacterium]|nr:hypothetical protein [Thermoanaerobaculia bacterium]
MTRITARAPVRIDLAGGTLDLWPLYLFHPGSRTVNVAISMWAECEIEPLGDPSIEVVLTDAKIRGRYASHRELAADERMSLVARAAQHFDAAGLRITTRTDAPRGSGLGGSSALAVALVRALSSFAQKPFDGEALVHLVRDLETRMLGIPAGIQDYYPAVYGGLAALHLDPGVLQRHPLTLPLAELGRHLILHYSGVAHFSGTNNWEMYKRSIDGEPRVRDGLGEISRISMEMEAALEAHDLAAAGAALDREWAARKRLVDGISTPEVDAVIETAKRAGAWAGKVCGAGGGGCIVILTPAEARETVIAALRNAPGRTLDVSPVGNGLSIEEEGDPSAYSFIHRRGMPGEQAIEQLWLAGDDSGPYRPSILAEAAITFDAPRHGVHRTIARTYLAPLDLQNGLPRWTDAREVRSDELDLHTAPEPGRESIAPRDPERLQEGIAEGEAAFRELLLESERLTMMLNPGFGLFSQSDETRADFIQRCLEHADQLLERESERLEKTYRRRLDQMRERVERDRRQIDEATGGSPDIKHQDVGIAWGQALYNITSGRPATSGIPRSPGEIEFLDKITQLQKSWDREREVLSDELNARARAVEEVVLTPSPRGIETRRYILVWIPTPRS